MLLSSNVALIGGNSTKPGSGYSAFIKAALSLITRCFSFFPECARSTVFFTNQYLLTYGFIFRFLIPLAEDFDTWTQEAPFTRIF